MRIVYIASSKWHKDIEHLEGSAHKYYRLMQQHFGGLIVMSAQASRAISEYNPSLIVVHGDRLDDYKLAKRNNIPYLLIEQDIASERACLMPHQAAQEQEMVEGAAAILFTSEQHAELLSRRYTLPEHRVVHLRPLKYDIQTVIHKPKLEGKHLVYAGGVIGNTIGQSVYGYKSFVGLFKRLIQTGWHVNLYPCQKNTHACRCYEQIGVSVHPSLPYRQLLSELTQYTVGLVGFNDCDVSAKALDYAKSCVPNKTFDYLAAGLPTVALNAPNAAALIEAGRWGRGIDKLDANTLDKAIDNIPNITDDMRLDNVMDNDIKALRDLLESVLCLSV